MNTLVYAQETLIDIIRSLMRKYKAQSGILFGSYARREATPQSDIDLIVIGGQSFHPTDVFCIAEELHQRTGKEVDVYELCEIDQDSDFYRAIQRDGVRIAA